MSDTNDEQRQRCLDGSLVPTTPREWWRKHKAEYEDHWRQVREARSVLLDGPIWAAAMNLKRVYVFAVMSQQTKTEVAERGFVEYVEGVPLRRAFEGCVYADMHSQWIEDGLENHAFEGLVRDIRKAVESDELPTAARAIRTLTDLKGLSYRKAGFTLAMCGLYEAMCIDRNVSYVVDTKDDKDDWSNARDYVASCEDVQEAAQLQVLEPFEAQWAIFDFSRDTVTSHEVVFENLILDPR